MDIHRLELFCKVYELGSFSKAAEEIRLSQPTVSGHIMSLEESLNQKLFDRLQREVVPTRAGELLYGYAKKILSIRTQALEAMEAYGGRISGRIRLGGSTIPGQYILPELLGRFKRKYPDTTISLIISGTKRVGDMVLQNDADLGLVGAKINDQRLEHHPFTRDDLILVAPADHPWGKRKRVTPEELRTAPFIIREPGSGTRRSMLEAMEKVGVTLDQINVVAEMGSTEAIREAVKSGVGVSILSKRAVTNELALKQLVSIPIQNLNLTRNFYLIYRRGRTHSPLAKAMIEFALQDIKDRHPDPHEDDD
ncbi:MAG: LysR family transcriptional regulator [Deltaproteobacteria bacterium]|nr:LysR family transcriptional regulator [Deltaproteobacteria bacterium]